LKLKKSPLPGVRELGDRSIHRSSFEMRCTAPVPIPSDFATFIGEIIIVVMVALWVLWMMECEEYAGSMMQIKLPQ
jgi:hypothetical protein